MPKMHSVIKPKGSALSDENYKEFEEALEICTDNSERLHEGELTFIEDMDSNHTKYSRGVFCSQVQLDWLKRIAARFN